MHYNQFLMALDENYSLQEYYVLSSISHDEQSCRSIYMSDVRWRFFRCDSPIMYDVVYGAALSILSQAEAFSIVRLVTTSC